MRWLLSPWYAICRRLDLQILWPACKSSAPDGNIDIAKAAFAMHAFHDKPWLALGDDEIIRRINELS